MTHEWLTGALVLGPLAFALLILAGPGGRARDGLVILATLAIMAGGVSLAFKGNGTWSLPAQVTAVGGLIEPLMIAAVLALGFMVRSWLVKGMAGVIKPRALRDEPMPLSRGKPGRA